MKHQKKIEKVKADMREFISQCLELNIKVTKNMCWIHLKLKSNYYIRQYFDEILEDVKKEKLMRKAS
jgi:hypothetical protein